MPNYTYPGSETLKNVLGITDNDQLERIEAAFVAARRAEIAAGRGPTGQFDAAHIKAIHRHLFQDVYEWAGHTRDERVSLSDGTIATEAIMKKAGGQPFLIGPAIPAALDGVAQKLRDANYLRSLPREQFAERAADVMGELNAVHAFREGNGRTQRTFMRELSKAAGHDLDFTVVPKERMTQASIAASEQGDPSMMRRMFDEISNPARVALLRQSIASLEKSDFKWNDRYIATLAPGHAVELVFAGAAGDQFMGRTRAEILFGKAADLPEPRPVRGESFTVTATPYPRQGDRQPGANGNPSPRRASTRKEKPSGEPSGADVLAHDLDEAKKGAAKSGPGKGKGRERS